MFINYSDYSDDEESIPIDNNRFGDHNGFNQAPNGTNVPNTNDSDFLNDYLLNDTYLESIYSKSREILAYKFGQLGVKDNLSIDYFLRDLYQSQLPDGSLVYPVEIQDILTKSISEHLLDSIESSSPYIQSFSFLDKQMSDFFQNSAQIQIQTPNSNIQRGSDESQDDLDSDLEPDSLSDILCLSFAKLSFSDMPEPLVISFLSSIKSLFDKTKDFSKLKVSKVSISAIQKFILQIFSNPQFDTPEINSNCLFLSICLAKAKKSFGSLIPYFIQLWKRSNNQQFELYDMTKYFQDNVQYKSEIVKQPNLIKIEGASRITKIIHTSERSLAAVSESGDIFSINLETSEVTKIQQLKVHYENYAISQTSLLEQIDNTNEFLLNSFDHSKQPKKIILKDIAPHNIFIDSDLSSSDFYIFSTDDFIQYTYVKIHADGNMSNNFELKVQNYSTQNKKLAQIKVYNSDKIAFHFEDSPVDIIFHCQKSTLCSIILSLLNQNSISSSIITNNDVISSAFVIEPNEIFIFDNFSSFCFNTNDQMTFAFSKQLDIIEYKKMISRFFKSYLFSIFNQILDPGRSQKIHDNKMMQFFTDSPILSIQNLLPLCLQLDTSNGNIELLSFFLLAITVCLYSLQNSITIELQNSLLELYEKLLKSDCVFEMPEIQDYIFLSMAISTNALFHDKEKTIKELFDIVANHPQKMKNFLRSGLLLLFIRSPIIFYIAGDKFFDLILKFMPISFFQLNLPIIIKNFSEQSSYNSNSKNLCLQSFLKGFVPKIANYAIESSSQWKLFFNTILSISFRMNSLEGSILPFYFAELISPFIPNFNKTFKETIIGYDLSEMESLQKPEHNFSLVEAEKVFEAHHSVNRISYSSEYYFPGASGIEVNVDYPTFINSGIDLRLKYTTFDFEHVNKAIDNPGQFFIPCDKVTVTCSFMHRFSAFAKLRFKGRILKDTNEFLPNKYQFIFAYFSHIIGKLLTLGLTSLPFTEKEEECKVLLQSNILQHTTPEQMLLEIQDKKNIPQGTKHKSPLKRGLSFNISQISPQSPETLESFLKAINSDHPKENGIAQLLLTNLNAKVKWIFPAGKQVEPKIASVEKASFAVMLKHLGVASEAYSYALVLTSNSSQPVPPNIHQIWRSIYKIRGSLIKLRQQCRSQNIDLNDPENEFNKKIKDCLLKCHFLLNNEPILRILINESKDNYDSSQTIEKAINELVSFIMSSVQFSEITALVELRKERYMIRMRALEMIQKVLKESNGIPNISFIHPIIPILTQVLKSGDTISLPLNMIDEFNKNISSLSEFLIDGFTNPENPMLIKLIYSQILTSPFIPLCSIESTEKLVKALIHFHIHSNDSMPESILEGITIFLAKIALYSQHNLLPLFDSIIQNYSECNDRIIELYLLIIATTTQLHRDYKYTGISTILKILNRPDNNPKIVTAALYAIGQLLCSDEYQTGNETLDFDKFVRLILKEIGTIYLNGTQEICTKTNSINDCNFYLADEMISFLRILLSPISKIHSQVNDIFHDALKTLKDKTPEATGCFLVLGFGIHSLKYSSNAFFTTKFNMKRAIVKQYSPRTQNILCNQNGKSALLNIKQAKPYAQPYARIPSSFILTEDECKDIGSSLNISECKDIDSSLTINDSSLFITLLASYLPVALQIKNNADNLLKFIPLESLLKMSMLNTNESTYISLNELCDKILVKPNIFPLSANIFSLTGPSINSKDNILVMSMKAKAYRLTVCVPGKDFMFGFFTDDDSFNADERILTTEKPKAQSQPQQPKPKKNKRTRKPKPPKDDDKETVKPKPHSSFSKRNYYLISPMSNRFINNSQQFKYFPLLPADQPVVQRGDKFTCFIYNNMVYFTICRTNQVYRMKIDNPSYMPFICSFNSTIISAPITEPTEPKTDKPIIDLDIARYSYAQAKKQEKRKRSTNPIPVPPTQTTESNVDLGFADLFDITEQKSETTLPITGIDNIEGNGKEQKQGKKKKPKKKTFFVNTDPAPFIEPFYRGSTVLLNTSKALIYQRCNNQSKSQLARAYNKYGTIVSTSMAEDQKLYADVEYLDKTTGEVEIIRIDTALLIIIDTPSIKCTLQQNAANEINQKDFIIRMLRYSTFLAIKSKLYSNLDNSSQLNDFSNKEEFFNLLVTLILELISTKYTDNSYNSFKEKIIEASQSINSKIRNNNPNSNLILPGDSSELSKELIELILLISKTIPDFYPNLLLKEIQNWPSPTFDDFVPFASSQASFNYPYITQNSYVNMEYTDLMSRGYMLLISPDTSLNNANKLIVTGNDGYKQEFTKIDPTVLLNSFTTNSQLTILFNGHSNPKQKINFLLVPVKKHFSNTKSPASYIHIFSVLINFAFAFLNINQLEFKVKRKLNDIFVSNIIPLLINKSKENDAFTLSIFDHFLTLILQQVNFRNNPLSFDLMKKFDSFCQNMMSPDASGTKGLPLFQQHMLTLKILLRKALYPLPYIELKQPSLMISRNSCNLAVKEANFKKQIISIDSIAKCEAEPIFLSTPLQDAEICYALTSSSYFPYYLLFDFWLSKQLSTEYQTISIPFTDFKYSYSNFDIESVNVIIELVDCPTSIIDMIEFQAVEQEASTLLNVIPISSAQQINSNHFNIVAIQQQIKDENLNNIKVKLTFQPTSLSDKGKYQKYMTNFNDFEKLVDIFETKWSNRVDESIMMLIDNSQSKLPENYQLICPVLAKYDPTTLDFRMYLIRKLNSRFDYILRLTNIDNIKLPLTQLLIKASPAIRLNFKEPIIRKKLSSTSHQLYINFNRSKAALAINNPTNPKGESLLDQLMKQVPINQLNRLNQLSQAPWHVNLEGEGAADAGGPGRELYTQICTEIMDVRSGLFTATPNRRREHGRNQDVLIPNVKILYKSQSVLPVNDLHRNETAQLVSSPSTTFKIDTINQPSNSSIQQSSVIDKHKLDQYFYLGALMAAAYPCKLPQPFCFANLVWSYLVGREVSIEEIYEIDEEFQQTMTSIKTCGPDVPFNSLYMLNFTTINSFGETVELIEGGTYINVNYENRLEYCRLCEDYRCREFNLPLQKMREGLLIILNDATTHLLSPWEMKMLLCGNTEIPVAELRKLCNIRTGTSDEENMLFKVLESFTPSERMLFIKFATGRMSLPPPGLDWSSPLNIEFMSSQNADNTLPHAATCASTIRIPRYSSEEIMTRMLRIAITYGGDIDQDNEVNLNEIVNLA